MGIIDINCVKELAEIAGTQQPLRTGLPPRQVDVAFAGDVLVMVLQDALTMAEKQLCQVPNASSQLQALHRELFLSSLDTMKQEIARVTGRAVRESTSELEPGSGSLVYAAATGAIIQVYILNPETNPHTVTLDDRTDSDSIERAADDGLRIKLPPEG